MSNFSLSGLLNNTYVGFTGSQGDTGFTGSQGDTGFTGSAGAGSFIFSATVEGSSGSSDWSSSEPSVATITVSGLLGTDVPIVDIDLSDKSFADVEAILADWSFVYRVEASANNQLKLYAFNEPSENFVLNIKVVR